jgi:hypothetical protein
VRDTTKALEPVHDFDWTEEPTVLDRLLMRAAKSGYVGGV